ncbi:hypothetical protein GQR58_030087 [Nymphon striatum]|nr:hypothetical protein GQR58_030087 [Nymphon striatum]
MTETCARSQLRAASVVTSMKRPKRRSLGPRSRTTTSPFVPRSWNRCPARFPRPRFTAASCEHSDCSTTKCSTRCAAAAHEGRKQFGAALGEAVAANPALAAIGPVVAYETLGTALPAGLEGAAPLWFSCQQLAMRHTAAVKAAGFEDVADEDLGDAVFDALLTNPDGVRITSHTYDQAWSMVKTGDGKVNADIPELIDDLVALADKPADYRTDDFPFILSAGERRAFTANTIMRDSTWRKKDPAGALRLSPADAAAGRCHRRRQDPDHDQGRLGNRAGRSQRIHAGRTHLDSELAWVSTPKPKGALPISPNRVAAYPYKVIRRFLALLLIAALVPLIVTDPAAAQGATVIFSEIHYHPQSVGEDFPDYDDREDTEFLELVNISAAPINVSNWCVRQAVDFCFPAGSTLNPQDPFVIARDAALFQGVYGVAPDATYTSRLSNSGEFIQLVDAAQSTVSQLIWDSTNPWPVTPDGNGPSLELVSSAGSVGSPANWAASSVIGGTPGSVPSLNGATPPLILSHTAPEPAVAGANVPLTAFSANATSVSVTYDINFGSNVTVPMTGNGGQWQVQLPALSTGDVMRFRFEATGPGGTTTSPRPDDSITWWATAVPTNPVSSVPTLDFHLSDASWSGIEARTCGCTAVIVHDGKVWTDVEMRRAGLTSIGQAKGSMRLDFPDGHPFEASWLVDTSDELTLDMGYPNHDLIREQISWQMMDDLGFPPIQSQHVRVSRNGNFHGLYLLRDEQDGDWRSRNDLDRGALYKFDQFGGRDGWGGGFTKKEGLDESDADLAALLSCVNQTGAALRSCMLDTIDVPQMAHEIAAMSLIRQVDQRWPVAPAPGGPRPHLGHRRREHRQPDRRLGPALPTLHRHRRTTGQRTVPSNHGGARVRDDGESSSTHPDRRAPERSEVAHRHLNHRRVDRSRLGRRRTEVEPHLGDPCDRGERAPVLGRQLRCASSCWRTRRQGPGCPEQPTRDHGHPTACRCRRRLHLCAAHQPRQTANRSTSRAGSSMVWRPSPMAP